MRRLIERLANVHRPAVRFGGEAILYHPKEDEWVRHEIRCTGKGAVPYLIEALRHSKEGIRGQAAVMLAEIPTRSGVEALMGCIEGESQVIPSTHSIQLALHRLTGYDKSYQIGTATPVATLRQIWLPWWKEHKDHLVDIEGGLGLRQDDGTVHPIGDGASRQRTKGARDGI